MSIPGLYLRASMWSCNSGQILYSTSETLNSKPRAAQHMERAAVFSARSGTHKAYRFHVCIDWTAFYRAGQNHSIYNRVLLHNNTTTVKSQVGRTGFVSPDGGCYGLLVHVASFRQ